MSNDFFRFKQFCIQQDRCAMKVTTDACIFGAWIPLLQNVKSVLDIGAGTGLLSLMLAQHNATLLVDAIEIEPNAATQAAENINASPWQASINLICGNAVNYPFIKKYDLIITNPPFFKNNLECPDPDKNLAKHAAELNNETLIEIVEAYLNEGGYFALILPTQEFKIFEQYAEQNNWTAIRKLTIQHTERAPVKRIAGVFCSKNIHAKNENEELIIYGNNGAYSEKFQKLMAPFYLDKL